MPTKKTTKKRDENGRFTKEEVAVVSSFLVVDPRLKKNQIFGE